MPRRYFGPALAVDAVCVRRGRVLLVRRGRWPYRGFWALPGGFVELRETVEQAVLRELREETGLVGKIDGLVGVYSGPHRDPRKPVASTVFLVAGTRGRLAGGDDADEARWVPVERIPRMAFDHRKILDDALALLNRRSRHRSTRARA